MCVSQLGLSLSWYARKKQIRLIFCDVTSRPYVWTPLGSCNLQNLNSYGTDTYYLPLSRTRTVFELEEKSKLFDGEVTTSICSGHFRSGLWHSTQIEST